MPPAPCRARSPPSGAASRRSAGSSPRWRQPDRGERSDRSRSDGSDGSDGRRNVSAKARSLFDPRVERFLIADEGEVIVDEVAKHWAAIVKPVLELVAAVPLLVLAFVVPPQV